MPYDFAIILNDKIIYCSRESQYSKFELSIFSKILIRQLADSRPWMLHKLIIKPIFSEWPEKLLIRTYISEDKKTEMDICILSELKEGSAHAYTLIDKFYQNIQIQYPINTIEVKIKEDSTPFISLCGTMAAMLFGETEGNALENKAEHESFIGDNQIIYIGISSNGSPLSAKIFNDQQLLKFESPEKKELLTSLMSGQLATISINANMRANCFMDSIQVKLSPEDNQYVTFDFDNFGCELSYTLTSLSTGNPYDTKEYFQIILDRLSSVPIFDCQFSGALKVYNPVKEFFETLQYKW
jgi:hypothetical protein